MGEPFIHLAGVQKVYRTRGADSRDLRGDLRRRGGRTRITRRALGCGKTTLLKVLAGFIVLIPAK
jgi:ABC-type Fe3+/spermidine/putrescine transport system ATPase subunit